MMRPGDIVLCTKSQLVNTAKLSILIESHFLTIALKKKISLLFQLLLVKVDEAVGGTVVARDSSGAVELGENRFG